MAPELEGTVKQWPTVKDWLEGLASSNQSSGEDSAKMENLMHKLMFPKARVVVGIVYPKGYGETVSIHQMAQLLLKVTAGS